MDTGKVTKANAPFWMAIAALLTTTIILMVQLFNSENFKPQIQSTVGMLLAAIMSVSVVRMLIQAVNSSLFEYSNPTADDAFKARSLVQGEPRELTLPEPLVL
ncbi:hypothetical protein [Pseudomonas sp. NFX224]|uniref:hypothetical protein n=1 Tax=Pseudomonas sp. NFX224 TaxID=3402862 RepID=UPI003AFA348F